MNLEKAIYLVFKFDDLYSWHAQVLSTINISADNTKFKTIATYANGDAMAIIQNRVGLIGCHPESRKYWYEKPWNYINQYWHNGEHHKLLLEFVNTLAA